MNLIRRIPPHHMLNGLVSSRMVLDPGVCLDDVLVQDEDVSALGDHGLDLTPREHGVLPTGLPLSGGFRK